MAKLEGLELLRIRLAALKAETKDQIAKAVDQGADEFLQTVQPLIPDGKLDPQPGALRASAHKEDGAHELARIVVADAKDDKGHEYGAHAELGHRTANGGHVEGFHVWYPVWRLTKKKILARIKRAQSAAARKVARG